MFRRSIIPVVVLALIFSACSGETVSTSTSTSTSMPQTTTSAPTTTTTQPLVIEDAPTELTALIETFYEYSYGSGEAPPLPPDLASTLVPIVGDPPKGGIATTGVFKESSVAVVSVGEDLFLAVADANGWRIVGGEWPALSVSGYYGHGPRLLAVVGSDARPGETVEKARADSIHFVGLDGTGGGAVVGLPRDSYVPIPGHGRRKVTGSLSLGGPDLLMQTLRDLTGLPLEGYVLTGFAGFEEMINYVLGPIEVDVPVAISDKASGAYLSAGIQMLNGFNSLAFARARKTLPGGDFTRSEHQGLLLLGAARGVRALGPLSLPRLIQGAEKYIITDLTAEQLLTFAMLSIRSDIDQMPNIVAPGSAGTTGGASVVFLADSASDLFADLVDGNLDD